MTAALAATRSTRTEAERVLHEALGLLARIALAAEGPGATDTAAEAKVLADMLDAATSRLVTARRLFLQRARVL
ncbi:hypothetical protein [Methylobacterium sp. GC_Met_2]|uniref:hypothetical protein n=1 Tax=Methylobacterium sp. GC_Met_2 TaxID=2937376 RepID=UPI00226B10B0|nr:hypothetical protein [Methylobacterium sp. GC_Met_2]